MKMKAFTVNSQNIKQVIDIQVTLISEKKLQKEHFLAKKTLSFRRLMRPF